MNKALWLIVLVLMTLTAMLCIQVKELQRQHMVLAVQMDGLEDRMNYQMQLINKYLNWPQQAEITRSDLPYMPAHDAKIEYSHPIYKIPENNK
jgi:hypothetical protein